MAYFGRSTTNGNAYAVNWSRVMGGQFSASSQTLNSVEIYCSSGGSGQARVAVYTGGTLSDPTGATLLEDLGAITAPATAAFTSISSTANPTIPANAIVWIYVHSATAQGFSVYASTNSADSGDFQSARGRGDLGVGQTPTGAAPASLGAASFSNFWYSWRLDATVAASGPDYTKRKGSTLTATHTLGTITTATLNAVNVFDHVSSQAAGTISFTGAITDERTTSGEVDLVLGDGAATQTQTVQVNVFGVVPSNNPAQKDGSALASLTGVQIRITAGANLNGTQVYYSGTETTNASGNFSTLDVSTSAAVAADPVRMQVLTAAGDSITSAETVGLI
jgi:hypothetical protein